MNLRLIILRCFAALTLLLGGGFVLMGIGLGLSVGGLVWLAAAVIIALGCLFIARIIRFLRKPTVADATDILTVFSVLFIYGAIGSTLKAVFPGGSGFAQLIGMKHEDSDPGLMLVAGLIAWAIYRGLKKLLLDAAFPPATIPKDEAAASR